MSGMKLGLVTDKKIIPRTWAFDKNASFSFFIPTIFLSNQNVYVFCFLFFQFVFQPSIQIKAKYECYKFLLTFSQTQCCMQAYRVYFGKKWKKRKKEVRYPYNARTSAHSLIHKNEHTHGEKIQMHSQVSIYLFIFINIFLYNTWMPILWVMLSKTHSYKH